MIITKEWINNHRTVNGGFTGAQTRILERLFNCKTYQSGWMDRIEHLEISEEDAKAFEQSRFVYAKSTKVPKPKVVMMKEPLKVEQELKEIKALLIQLLEK